MNVNIVKMNFQPLYALKSNIEVNENISNLVCIFISEQFDNFNDSEDTCSFHALRLLIKCSTKCKDTISFNRICQQFNILLSKSNKQYDGILFEFKLLGRTIEYLMSIMQLSNESITNKGDNFDSIQNTSIELPFVDLNIQPKKFKISINSTTNFVLLYELWCNGFIHLAKSLEVSDSSDLYNLVSMTISIIIQSSSPSYFYLQLLKVLLNLFNNIIHVIKINVHVTLDVCKKLTTWIVGLFHQTSDFVYSFDETCSEFTFKPKVLRELDCVIVSFQLIQCFAKLSIDITEMISDFLNQAFTAKLVSLNGKLLILHQNMSIFSFDYYTRFQIISGLVIDLTMQAHLSISSVALAGIDSTRQILPLADILRFCLSPELLMKSLDFFKSQICYIGRSNINCDKEKLVNYLKLNQKNALSWYRDNELYFLSISSSSSSKRSNEVKSMTVAELTTQLLLSIFLIEGYSHLCITADSNVHSCINNQVNIPTEDYNSFERIKPNCKIQSILSDTQEVLCFNSDVATFFEVYTRVSVALIKLYKCNNIERSFSNVTSIEIPPSVEIGFILYSLQRFLSICHQYEQKNQNVFELSLPLQPVLCQLFQDGLLSYFQQFSVSDNATITPNSDHANSKCVKSIDFQYTWSPSDVEIDAERSKAKYNNISNEYKKYLSILMSICSFPYFTQSGSNLLQPHSSNFTEDDSKYLLNAFNYGLPQLNQLNKNRLVTLTCRHLIDRLSLSGIYFLHQ